MIHLVQSMYVYKQENEPIWYRCDLKSSLWSDKLYSGSVVCFINDLLYWFFLNPWLVQDQLYKHFTINHKPFFCSQISKRFKSADCIYHINVQVCYIPQFEFVINVDESFASFGAL